MTQKIPQFLLVMFVFILVGVVLFSSSGRDDSHITYYEVDSLYEHGKLLSINNENFQQATSVLFVVVLAATKAILSGISTPTIGPILSIMFGIGALWLTTNLAGSSSNHTIFSSLLLSVDAYFVYWAFSGMETTLIALLICLFFWALIDYLRPSQANGFLLISSTIVLTSGRPEHFFVINTFLALYAGLIFILSRDKNFDLAKHKKAIVLIGVSSAITFVSILVFNYIQSGYLFPLPVYAKSSGIDPRKIYSGSLYILRSVSTNIPFFLFLVGLYVNAIIIWRYKDKNCGKNIIHLLATFYVSAHLLFVMFSGGDWMEGGRFLAPIAPIVYAFGIPFITSLVLRRLLAITTLGFSVWSISAFALHQSTGMSISEAMLVDRGKILSNVYLKNYSWFEYTNRVHLRDLLFIEETKKIIEPHLKQNNSIAIMSMQMGMVPYHLKRTFGDRIKFIDIKGLATDHFLKCKSTRNRRKTTGGLDFDYAYYFLKQDDIRRECGITKPDFIFDLGNRTSKWAQLAESNGYKVVYQQEGLIKGMGGDVQADQFLAIREDLLLPTQNKKILILP